MLKLCAGALVALFSFASPSLAQVAVKCAPIGNVEVALADQGATLLGGRPVPWATGVMLYWRDAHGLVIGAPVFRSAESDGRCVAYQEIIVLGPYEPETSS